jgi:hypothetical protein
MKLFCLHISLFFCLTFLGQSKQAIAIKIYLEDAETNKNVSDAKVTLEGFEIPAITGKYDKEGKFYYFTEIPAGYNTVMAYHKKYNEKGFQNTEGLPKELNLKLYTPYRVQIPGDSLNYYKEDPFKLVVTMNDTLYNSIIKCENFGNHPRACFIKKYFKEHYPDLVVDSEAKSFFPTYDISFYVTRKNNKRFKRFNDPIIKKMIEDDNILFFHELLLKTKIYSPFLKIAQEYFSVEGKPNYIPKYIKYVNYDTLIHLQSNQRIKDNYYTTFDKKGKIIKAKIIKTPKKKYSDIYLSYKDKYKRGLLKNDIYTLNEKELDSLYKIDVKKTKKGFLYEFDILNDKNIFGVFTDKDTIIDDMTQLSYKKNHVFFQIIPYIAISNILEFNSFQISISKNGRFGYSIYYDKNNLYGYKKNEDLVKLSRKNGNIIYKIKNNFASPFGTIDLMEYYNLSNKKIYLKIEKDIQK